MGRVGGENLEGFIGLWPLNDAGRICTFYIIRSIGNEQE